MWRIWRWWLRAPSFRSCWWCCSFRNQITLAEPGLNHVGADTVDCRKSWSSCLLVELRIACVPQAFWVFCGIFFAVSVAQLLDNSSFYVFVECDECGQFGVDDCELPLPIMLMMLLVPESNNTCWARLNFEIKSLVLSSLHHLSVHKMEQGKFRPEEIHGDCSLLWGFIAHSIRGPCMF